MHNKKGAHAPRTSQSFFCLRDEEQERAHFLTAKCIKTYTVSAKKCVLTKQVALRHKKSKRLPNSFVSLLLMIRGKIMSCFEIKLSLDYVNIIIHLFFLVNPFL